MDQQDKIYLWMVVAALLALCVAIGFSVVETKEIRETQVQSAF